jgi:hypothetical protein
VTSRSDALREGYRQYVQDRRRERLRLPQCANVRWTRSGFSGRKRTRICGRRTVHNAIERERGTYWCPRCGTYPFGNGLGPDVLP